VTAEALRALHTPGKPLVLPNAWDAESARLVAAAGFPVVATSSTALAASLGYADGHDAPPDEVFAAVARICRRVDVPVTADLEGGYGLAPAELVERTLAAGAVGLNFEDTDHEHGGLTEAARQAEKIAAIKAAAGDALVLNARVDAHLSASPVAVAERLSESLRRAQAYAAAGADCVFPIAMGDPDDIAAYVKEMSVPVNISYGRGALSVQELAALGVGRISLGGGLMAVVRATINAELAKLT
jgi:2-methylisocitrate lyase-like PEP mutase family enzyme